MVYMPSQHPGTFSYIESARLVNRYSPVRSSPRPAAIVTRVERAYTKPHHGEKTRATACLVVMHALAIFIEAVADTAVPILHVDGSESLLA